MNENDKLFFDELINNNPNSFDVANIRNFDGVALVQIIVDSAVALSAPFLTALGLFLKNPDLHTVFKILIKTGIFSAYIDDLESSIYQIRAIQQ